MWSITCRLRSVDQPKRRSQNGQTYLRCWYFILSMEPAPDPVSDDEPEEATDASTDDSMMSASSRVRVTSLELLRILEAKPPADELLIEIAMGDDSAGLLEVKSNEPDDEGIMRCGIVLTICNDSLVLAVEVTTEWLVLVGNGDVNLEV